MRERKHYLGETYAVLGGTVLGLVAGAFLVYVRHIEPILSQLPLSKVLFGK